MVKPSAERNSDMNNKTRTQLFIVAVITIANSTTHTADQRYINPKQYESVKRWINPHRPVNIEAANQNLLQQIQKADRSNFEITAYIADVNVCDDHSSDPAVILATKKVTDAFDNLTILLAHNKLKVNKPNLYGETALHVASKGNNIDLARALIEGKAEVNAKTNVGVTPIILAASADNYDMVDLLLKNNANTTEIYVPVFTSDEKIKKLLQDHAQKRTAIDQTVNSPR